MVSDLARCGRPAVRTDTAFRSRRNKVQPLGPGRESCGCHPELKRLRPQLGSAGAVSLGNRVGLGLTPNFIRSMIERSVAGSPVNL
jgi:hypothetical protein